MDPIEKQWLRRIGALIVLIVFGWGVREGYIYVTEVPAGHQRLDFKRDFTSKIHIDAARRVEIDQSLYELKGKPIFLKGFMYPTGETEGVPVFLFMWDTFSPGFGPSPTVADYFNVELAAGDTFPFCYGVLSVWGTLRVDRTPQSDTAAISLVDAHCEPARSRF